jgi:hypothetical protein
MNDDDQLEYMEKKRAELEAGNNRSYNELRQKLGPTFTMDTGDMRRELFMKHLLKWGIITEEQGLEFEIEFHSQVESSLNGYWEELRKQEKGRGLTVVKNPDKLLDQHGRPIK